MKSNNIVYFSAKICLIGVPPRPIFLHFAELLQELKLLRQLNNEFGALPHATHRNRPVVGVDNAMSDCHA